MFLLAALAVTGVPPFSIFQSEFIAISAALAADHGGAAALFLLGVVTIFAGFLLHMAKLNLGAAHEAPTRVECPWKLGAMVLVAVVVTTLGFWLPDQLFVLIQQSAHIIGGAL